MGFSKAAIYAELSSKYGPVSGPFSYVGVNCTGSEVTLDECTNSNTESCGSGTGAGVVCESASVLVIFAFAECTILLFAL